MNLKANMGAQGILVALITLVQSSAASPDAKLYLTVGLGVIMAGVSFYVHNRNPDGTNAKAPYEPKR